MAQYMYFRQYPKVGIGTVSSYYYLDGAQQPNVNLRGGNGSGGPYLWASMPLSPGATITTAQCQAIGALCYDAGVAVHMQYTSSESGAYMSDALTALKSVFKYSNSICGGDGIDNIGAGLIVMLNPNLDLGHPCLLGINGSVGGHAVVVDGYGYDTAALYHHLNLGWSGADSLWYNLPNINTPDGIDFNVVNNCVYNIYTTGSGEMISGRVLDANEKPVSGATVQAVPTAGATQTTTTNANGIYAFAHILSGTTYTLSATAPGQTYANLTAVTGISSDNDATLGNVWGSDFLVPTTMIVQSTPPTGLVIGSSTGHGGTTNYLVPGVALGTSVNLSAPATDPTGWYIFAQWTLNGTPQAPGQESITFPMSPAATAVAQYMHIIYVKRNATGANDGTLWTNAFTQLQSALDTAESGDQIWVAAGTYAPTYDYGMGAGAQGSHFEMVNGVGIYGGFAGTETLLSQRNWTTNVTTLTGQGYCYHVFYHDNYFDGLSLDATAVLDGVTITGANANGSPDFPYADVCDGGGMYNSGCSPTITNCTFSGNSADDWGGAMENWSCAPTLMNCGFISNSAGIYGGGIDNEQSSPVVTNCTFTGNASASGNGGGMDNWYSAPILTNCTFSGNLAAWGGGMYSDYYSTPVVTNCILWDDSAATGAEIFNTDYTSTLAFAFCDITDCGGSGVGWDGTLGTDGGGNIAADPKFTSPVSASSAPTTSGDYHLTAGSPCIDSADGPASPATDKEGNPRHDDPGMPNVGIGPPWADMGAYEFQGTTCHLSVQSTPPAGLSIGSSTGQSGTTNYSSIAGQGASVNLQAPAIDPTGWYTFSQWTVNGTPQTAGQQSITFAMPADIDSTAVAQYVIVTYTLTVQSQNPASGVSITVSPTDTNGLSDGTTGTPPLTRTYYAGTSVTLTAPWAASGNNFWKWQKNGADYSTNPAITVIAGNDTYTAAYLTPMARYTLAVQSKPPTGLSIGSCTGHGCTTNWTTTGVGNGTCVNLQAPATEPAGYTFSQWLVNGAAQTPGQKGVTFMLNAATTAVAQYTANMNYTLTVQSGKPVKQVIGSSTGHGGTTYYTVPGLASGTSVNLAAPATDPVGFSFSQWKVNGAAQAPGQKSVTFTVDAATMAVADYALTGGWTLTVHSTPPIGVLIGSSTGHDGTTNYTKTMVADGASVNLQAPATDPAGYAFSQWTVNGAAQAPGQKSVTFAMNEAVTAVAQYTRNTGYTLTVQSTPPIGLSISSSTGQNGTTNYTVPGIAYATSVNLEAPPTDPAGYTFAQWTLNGATQTPGQKSVTFTMDAAATAVAQYTPNMGYTLTVQSAPPTGVSIGSSASQSGTTNYTVTKVAQGTSVNLQAPDTDPAGYTFLQWTVNGAAQTAGQKSITFTMDGATTAVAQYTLNGYTLTVESTPPNGLSIASSTGHAGKTNYYTNNGVADGTSVNLQAPATDPKGYTFLQWTVNGAPQTAGQKSITFTIGGATTAAAQYAQNRLRADRAVHAADRVEHRFKHGPERHDELHGCRRRVRDEREPSGPGDGPGRIRLHGVDPQRRGANRRPEVHHVHVGCGGDRGGALRAEHRLHADRAVHAAGQAAHRFEHRPRRHDELHADRRQQWDERELAGPGDGPGRVHLLAVDGERRGAESGAEVHHVHDECGRDRGGALHAEHRLRALRAFHAADPAEHQFEHELQLHRHDKLRDSRRPIRYERQPAGPAGGPGRVHLLAVDAQRRGADRRAEVHHVHDGWGHDRRGAVHGQHRLHAHRAVHAGGQAGHRFGHGPRRHDELHEDRGRVRDKREPAGPGDGPGRVHLLAVDAQRRGAGRRAEVHHVHVGWGRDRRGALHAERRLHALRAVHASGQAGHRLQHGPCRHDELHEDRGRVRYEREPSGPGHGPDRVYLLAVEAQRRGAACRAEVHHVHNELGHDGRGGISQGRLAAPRRKTESFS